MWLKLLIYIKVTQEGLTDEETENMTVETWFP